MGKDVTRGELVGELERGLKTFRAFEHAKEILAECDDAENKIASANAEIATLENQRKEIESDIRVRKLDESVRLGVAEDAIAEKEDKLDLLSGALKRYHVPITTR